MDIRSLNYGSCAVPKLSFRRLSQKGSCTPPTVPQVTMEPFKGKPYLLLVGTKGIHLQELYRDNTPLFPSNKNQ